MPDDVGLPVSDTGRKPHFLQNLTAAIYFNPCDVASDYARSLSLAIGFREYRLTTIKRLAPRAVAKSSHHVVTNNLFNLILATS